MKIRTGFVANSSSVSFCIYGTRVDTCDDVVRELVGELLLKDGKGEEADKLKGSEYATSEWLEHFCGQLGLYARGDQFGDYLYIGREWSSIKDDETGKQFKDSVEELVAKLFPNVKCSTHEEGWFDG